MIVVDSREKLKLYKVPLLSVLDILSYYCITQKLDLKLGQYGTADNL